LNDAGFSHVTIQDDGADLNAYTLVNDQPGCCSTSPVEETPLVELGGTSPTESCCGGGNQEKTIHAGLAEAFAKVDINEYAASVKVYAVKP